MVSIEMKGYQGAEHGDELNVTGVDASYVGKLLSVSDRGLTIRDCSTGQSREIGFPAQNRGGSRKEHAGITMTVSEAESEQFAAAVPGHFRVLEYDKLEHYYTLEAGENGFDFSSLQDAMMAADRLDMLTRQGFVTNDTGRIIYQGPTQCDLDL